MVVSNQNIPDSYVAFNRTSLESGTGSGAGKALGGGGGAGKAEGAGGGAGKAEGGGGGAGKAEGGGGAGKLDVYA